MNKWNKKRTRKVAQLYARVITKIINLFLPRIPRIETRIVEFKTTQDVLEQNCASMKKQEERGGRTGNRSRDTCFLCLILTPNQQSHTRNRVKVERDRKTAKLSTFHVRPCKNCRAVSNLCAQKQIISRKSLAKFICWDLVSVLLK